MVVCMYMHVHNVCVVLDVSGAFKIMLVWILIISGIYCIVFYGTRRLRRAGGRVLTCRSRKWIQLAWRTTLASELAGKKWRGRTRKYLQQDPDSRSPDPINKYRELSNHRRRHTHPASCCTRSNLGERLLQYRWLINL